MKTIMGILSLSVCLFAVSGCAVYAEGPYVPGSSYGGYAISSVYTQGVDDAGNMWIDVQGSFDPTDSSVYVDCGSYSVDAVMVSASTSDLLISLPATSDYSTCNFTVQTGGVVTLTFSASVSAMDFTGSSVNLDANPSYLDVRFYGDFYVQHLNNSQLSVKATCNGGSTVFYPPVTYQSPTEIDVKISNPGYGYSENCQFAVEDSFVDAQNNVVTVTSPTFSKIINGI